MVMITVMLIVVVMMKLIVIKSEHLGMLERL